MAEVVLYRYSTSNHNVVFETGYINAVVLYRYSTSNHNRLPFREITYRLSYIVILHQTTTTRIKLSWQFCCLISLFYIKPQLLACGDSDIYVVLYRYSTSNHNLLTALIMLFSVVLYRYSTSNHNVLYQAYSLTIVVLYRYSTSNHNIYYL